MLCLLANLVKNYGMNLFSDSNKIRLNMTDADVVYYPNFFSNTEANTLFITLLKHTPWQQDDITLFGKTHKQPRLTSLHGNNGKSYTYSNITMQPNSFNKELVGIKAKIETITDVAFSTCLLNLYRDGSDSNGWHADDEKELGINPIIASVSFGAERIFHFKHKKKKDLKEKLVLQHGSLLLMGGTTQHHWLHQLPKTKKKIGKRINLTFRCIA